MCDHLCDTFINLFSIIENSIDPSDHIDMTNNYVLANILNSHFRDYSVLAIKECQKDQMGFTSNNIGLNCVRTFLYK